MVPFFVQIKCQLGKSYEVADRLADAEIASEIYSTAGDFDLLVKFYIEPGTDIGHFIAQKVQTIPGIQDTRTIITFKAFGGAERSRPGFRNAYYGFLASGFGPPRRQRGNVSRYCGTVGARKAARY